MAFLDNLDQWYYWLILVLSILLMTLVLYLTVRLVCGRKKLDGGYFLRLFLVSILLIVVVEAVAQAVDSIVFFLISSIGYILVTIGFILVIRYLITVPAVLPHAVSGDKYWQWSIIITIVSIVFMLLIATVVFFISDAIGDPIYIFAPGV